MEWLPYPGGRKVKKYANYSVIVPESYVENNKEIMPLFCDVCTVRYSTQEDEKTYKLFGCCSICADTWAYSNKKEWEKGWRPTTEMINKSLDKRIFINDSIRFE